MQKNNAFNKFLFLANFFSYRFIQNFTKLCDSNKSRFIFSGKRIFTTLPFPIFGNKFSNGWNHEKSTFQNKILINKLLDFLILENWKLLSCEDSFFWQNGPWFIIIASFCKIWYEGTRKKVRVEMKFFECILFLHFKFCSWKITFSHSN